MKALSQAWLKIMQEDPRVKPVSFYLTSGRSSSCGTVSFEEANPVLRINLQRGGVNLPAPELMERLLHQAAHAAAGTSTANEGRWHTTSYRDAAVHLGLDVQEDKNGWAQTSLARGTKTRYKPEISALDKALATWRPVAARQSNRGPIALTCSCVPPRTFRMASGSAAKGPIVCTICGAEFTAV